MQREQNPDVNTPYPDSEASDVEQSIPGPGTARSEQGGDEDIPVPPDKHPGAPVEEPPGIGGPPMGDVDDSPKKIVDDRGGEDSRF